jgi:uncharacterized membrane protein
MATVVNDAGQIAGVSGDHAVLWSGDTVTPLDGSGTGSMGTPTGINAAGTVVGNMFMHPRVSARRSGQVGKPFGCT